MAVRTTDIRLTCATLIKLSSRTASLKELNQTIQYMYDNKKYKKMVLYIEASESGSMMNRLPNNIDVYPTTAANPTKSAYACYGKERDILWRSLQHQLDGGFRDGETVQGDTTQFILVKQHINTSYVMQYRNWTISKMKVSQFQGSTKTVVPPMTLEPTCSSRMIAILCSQYEHEISVLDEQIQKWAVEHTSIATSPVFAQKEKGREGNH
ncbi:hypothetical protein AB205_0009360 [Aquarana catesbeiana]|uniref:Uncharacterized protein n=1 Tax=Aquarana catesbeiana TaxID=8400 RepID=A0A2G9S041_AQUCT|nr:hypothetical protein AB205_0009360 [Aquarana catesbeiana]